MLISSCEKEGPLGFKTGQEYFPDYNVFLKVADVGEDWVEFTKTEYSDYNSRKGAELRTKEIMMRRTYREHKSTLEKDLPKFDYNK